MFNFHRKSTLEGNKGKRAIAKLILNSLYGKFAMNPVAAFITAWGRYTTITSAQKVYDGFIYADTDGLRIEGTDFRGGWI